MKCPYSIGAGSTIPEPPSSIHAAKGTIAHEVCEHYAQHILFDAPKTATLMTATDENMRSAMGWVEVLTAWRNDTERIGDILHFALEGGLPIYPEQGCFGTADLIIVGTKGCVVIDFKNGIGHIVGAGSSQLQIYLLSVLLHVEELPEDYKFHAVVYQPRVDDIPKEHIYGMNDMRMFNLSVVEAIEKAKLTNNEPVMGSHCHWCKARTTKDPSKLCPAQGQKHIDLAGQRFDKYLAETNGVSSDKRDKALIKLMSIKPLIDNVVKMAEAEFNERLIVNSEKIDGLVMIDKKGNRQWAHGEGDISAMLQSKGIESHKQINETKLKTVTEVEREVGKKNFDVSLVVRPIKKKIMVADHSIKQILGDFANYSEGLVE